jgi:hypothetical protein
MKTVAEVYHDYNGVSVNAFAELVRATPAEVRAVLRSGWVQLNGKHPEALWTPGRYGTPCWSISRQAAPRFSGLLKRLRLLEYRELVRNKWESGVYIVRTEEGPRRYKIGYASNPAGRLNGLQGMSAVRLSMVAFMSGKTGRFEHRLHKVFRAARLHGEWFTETPALLWLCERYPRFMEPTL